MKAKLKAQKCSRECKWRQFRRELRLVEEHFLRLERNTYNPQSEIL